MNGLEFVAKSPCALPNKDLADEAPQSVVVFQPNSDPMAFGERISTILLGDIGSGRRRVGLIERVLVSPASMGISSQIRGIDVARNCFEKIFQTTMSRRSAEGGSLKGVTTVRNGQSFSVNIPKFSPPANANSINIVVDEVHDRFRKLTPKQRIAVLTVRDRNIASKLYVLSNVRFSLPLCIRHPLIIGAMVSENE